ncbi:LysR family transcriptional regulator [Shewanella avicenniae]|uniref:LysR family transcriptional regulator n=1 Tax=Shewanella avicenniae TaxID=2814294 RepID=A0ABX7QPB2_9GAMM|nr:LysR family transcriptional regulator [Shewanella avicenniae]QSX33303.1 LysR family transcriptional regulator [Shewanella avicenniae]
MYKTTLEQWLAFKAVFESGGFTAAAEQLNRSQSTVSYAIAKLQRQLGVKLITMDGKRCELTDIGQKLLNDALPLLQDFENLEKKARFLSSGVEANIHLLLENIFPKDVLFAAIARLAERYPFTQVHLHERMRLQASDDTACDLAISVSEAGLLPGPKLLEVRLIPVAQPQHPIFTDHQGPLSTEELMQYKQIYYQRLGRDVETLGNLSRQQWAVNSVESAVAAIKAKICYGSLPEHSIAPFLASGELRKIPLTKPVEYSIPLYLSINNRTEAGPATQYFAECLLATCQQLHSQ